MKWIAFLGLVGTSMLCADFMQHEEMEQNGTYQEETQIYHKKHKTFDESTRYNKDSDAHSGFEDMNP